MNDTTTDVPVATGGKDRGFTLIELLIVIVILGVLATVTVFAVRGISDKGNDSACAADKNTLETAIESYFAQEGVTTIPTATTASGKIGTTAEETLQLSGFLRTGSSKFNIDPNGSLIEVDGNGVAVVSPARGVCEL